MHQSIRRPFILGLIFLAAGISASSGSATDGNPRYLNGGYCLLYELCGDESRLPLLLDVKHAPEEIVKFATRISKTAKQTDAAIEHMRDGDRDLDYSQNPLPQIELDVRASIKGDKQHQLLFGTSGADFVRALLVSQIEASNYALTLAKVLAEHESDAKRIKSLEEISAKWSAIHHQAFRLLAAEG